MNREGRLGVRIYTVPRARQRSELSQLLYDCALLLRGEVMLKIEKERKMEIGYMLRHVISTYLTNKKLLGGKLQVPDRL